jgi:FtsP/CotA-like multicopper oxidase with cupredoxin domain
MAAICHEHRPARQTAFEPQQSVESAIMSIHHFKLSTVALALAAALLPTSQAFAKDYYLKAGAFDMPDPNGGSNTIRMWGYAECDNIFKACQPFSVPGPALTLSQGDGTLSDANGTLTVHLLNQLPQATSLVINGLNKKMKPVWTTDEQGRRRVRSFDEEVDAGETVIYEWTNVKPGSYLYQSGTQPQVQVQMGLYGSVSKNAVDALGGSAPVRAQAYFGAYDFDAQATLLYSEIDPALHAAVADGSYGQACGSTEPDCGRMTSTFGYAPTFFLINGKPYQLGTPVIAPQATVGPAGSTTLVRLLNAGLTTHVPMIQGAYWDVIAEDGRPYPYRARQYTALLPAAKTMDLLLTRPSGVSYAIMDRRLSLSNGGMANGGMLAFLGDANGGALAGGGLGGGSSGGQNQPPIALADVYSSVAGVALNIAAPGVLVNDDATDGPALGAVAVASGPTTCGGTYSLNANGAFIYHPPVGTLPCSTLSGASPNFFGTDSFSYRATDGGAQSASPATVTISMAIPTPPVLTTLDDFNRIDATRLGTSSVGTNVNGAAWLQQTNTISGVDIGIQNEMAIANPSSQGGPAILNQLFTEKQGAGFAHATPLAGSALVLKATGGTSTAPANYVRVRCEAGILGEVVVATMVGGSNASMYVKQAAFPASGCLANTGSLQAVVDEKGLVTTFLNGAYAGGVQLPDVATWKGMGMIGIQLQPPTGAMVEGATVEDFQGGSL